MTEAEIAAVAGRLTPLEASALADCCKRGSTRTNDGGLVDDLLSGLCSNTADGIFNGWLVTWSMNPNSREDGYINLYTPTELGQHVTAHLQGQATTPNDSPAKGGDEGRER